MISIHIQMKKWSSHNLAYKGPKMETGERFHITEWSHVMTRSKNHN